MGKALTATCLPVPVGTASSTRKIIRRKMRASPPEGQTDLEGHALPGLSLRDKIPKGVHTLFVGINPGERSARISHYYAGHSNYFWKLLHASGIWPVKLKAENDDDIVAQGFGLTDVAKRPTPGVAHLSKADFFESKRRINRIVKRHDPKTVAFVGLTAVRAYLGDPTQEIAYGLQDWKVHDSTVFVLPSTSGASLGHTSYADKLVHFKALKTYISTYYAFTKKS